MRIILKDEEKEGKGGRRKRRKDGERLRKQQGPRWKPGSGWLERERERERVRQEKREREKGKKGPQEAGEGKEKGKASGETARTRDGQMRGREMGWDLESGARTHPAPLTLDLPWWTSG